MVQELIDTEVFERFTEQEKTYESILHLKITSCRNGQGPGNFSFGFHASTFCIC